jgi:hypothetical protein
MDVHSDSLRRTAMILNAAVALFFLLEFIVPRLAPAQEQEHKQGSFPDRVEDGLSVFRPKTRSRLYACWSSTSELAIMHSSKSWK